MIISIFIIIIMLIINFYLINKNRNLISDYKLLEDSLINDPVLCVRIWRKDENIGVITYYDISNIENISDTITFYQKGVKLYITGVKEYRTFLGYMQYDNKKQIMFFD